MKSIILLLITIFTVQVFGASASFSPTTYEHKDGSTLNTVQFGGTLGEYDFLKEIKLVFPEGTHIENNSTTAALGFGFSIDDNTVVWTDVWIQGNVPHPFSVPIKFSTSLDEMDVSCSFKIYGNDAVIYNTTLNLSYVASGSSTIEVLSGNTSLPTPEWDAGEVVVGKTSKDWLDFSIKNTGSSNVTIESVEFRNGSLFHFVNAPGEDIGIGTLEPGEVDNFRIEFAPTSAGSFNETLTIIYQGSKAQTVINLLGKGINLPNNQYQFGQQYITAEQNLPIHTSKNSKIQTIYETDGMTNFVEGHKINKIFYQYSGDANWENVPVKMYINSIDDDSFTNGNFKELGTLSYDGIATIFNDPSNQSYWYKFELSTPYEINSINKNKNLLVTVVKENVTNTNNGGAHFWSSEALDSKTISSSSDGSVSGVASGTPMNYIPNTRFSIVGPAPEFSLIGSDEHDFGYVVENNSSDPYNYKIKNTGGYGLEIKSIELNNTDYSLSSNSPFPTTNDPITLDGNEEFSFNVTYNPTGYGHDHGEITITYNVGGGDTTKTIGLDGFGRYENGDSVDGSGNGAIEIPVNDFLNGAIELVNTIEPYSNSYNISNDKDVVYSLTLTDSFLADISVQSEDGLSPLIGIYEGAANVGTNPISNVLNSYQNIDLNATTYYIVVDGNGTSSSASNYKEFNLNITIKVKDVPTGNLTPADGAVNVLPSNISFDWPSSPSADGYYISIWKGSSQPYTYVIENYKKQGDSQYTHNETLEKGIKYFWKVKPYNDTHGDSISGPSTDVWSFTTAQEEPEGPFYWGGSIDSDWNNPGNWYRESPSGDFAVSSIVPGVTDVIGFRGADFTISNNIVLDEDKIVKSIIFTFDYSKNLINLNGKTLKVVPSNTFSSGFSLANANFNGNGTFEIDLTNFANNSQYQSIDLVAPFYRPAKFDNGAKLKITVDSDAQTEFAVNLAFKVTTSSGQNGFLNGLHISGGDNVILTCTEKSTMPFVSNLNSIGNLIVDGENTKYIPINGMTFNTVSGTGALEAGGYTHNVEGSAFDINQFMKGTSTVNFTDEITLSNSYEFHIVNFKKNSIVENSISAEILNLGPGDNNNHPSLSVTGDVTATTVNSYSSNANDDGTGGFRIIEGNLLSGNINIYSGNLIVGGSTPDKGNITNSGNITIGNGASLGFCCDGKTATIGGNLINNNPTVNYFRQGDHKVIFTGNENSSITGGFKFHDLEFNKESDAVKITTDGVISYTGEIYYTSGYFVGGIRTTRLALSYDAQKLFKYTLPFETSVTITRYNGVPVPGGGDEAIENYVTVTSSSEVTPTDLKVYFHTDELTDGNAVNCLKAWEQSDGNLWVKLSGFTGNGTGYPQSPFFYWSKAGDLSSWSDTVVKYTASCTTSSSLPVAFDDENFYGSVDNSEGSVNLSWKTHSEEGLKGFIIWRSNLEFGDYKIVKTWKEDSSLATKNEGGFSTNDTDYTFIDHLDKSGTYYYKVEAYCSESDREFHKKTVKVDYEMEFEEGLSQNYPNPFNNVTSISFALNSSKVVNLSVYNIKGEMVAKLVDGAELSKGIHTYKFESANLSSGVYLYRLNLGKKVYTKRMMFVK